MDFIDIFNTIKKQEQEDTIKISYLVIDYCEKNKIELTNLKLIKLLYFINIKYMLYTKGTPIFNEEFLAWRHGPVLQSVYNYFCVGIVNTTSEKIEQIKNELSSEKVEIIYDVLAEKAHLNAWDLVQETHVSNGPWDIIYSKNKNEDGICTHIIPNEMIYKYYSGI